MLLIIIWNNLNIVGVFLDVVETSTTKKTCIIYRGFYAELRPRLVVNENGYVK